MIRLRTALLLGVGCFLAALCVTAATASTLAPAHAAQVVPTPCPGPSSPTPTPTVYGSPPPHTTYHEGGKAFCGPPPPGPFGTPHLCGVIFQGHAAEFSVITCAFGPPPLCGTRTAKSLFVGGTNLDLTAPGYEIFQVTSSGTFVQVSAITGGGGLYEFVGAGGSPVTLVGPGNCVLIPLPVTGGAMHPDSGINLQLVAICALGALLVAAGVFAGCRPLRETLLVRREGL